MRSYNEDIAQAIIRDRNVSEMREALIHLLPLHLRLLYTHTQYKYLCVYIYICQKKKKKKPNEN